jgi:hypothetical protein
MKLGAGSGVPGLVSGRRQEAQVRPVDVLGNAEHEVVVESLHDGSRAGLLWFAVVLAGAAAKGGTTRHVGWRLYLKP